MQEARYLPAFDADLVECEQDDLLDIGPDLDAMASLVAARDIQPPLSIGLFGDWGAGKSFFMEKLQARVADITRPSQQPPDHGFCRGIVQIRFNAWHYVESNLWASLLHTIFRRLEEAVRGGSPDGEARLDVLRERLQRAMERRTEVQRELEALDRRLDRARQERDRVAREKEEAEAQARSLRATGLPTIGEELRAQLERLLREVRDNLGIQGLPAAVDATRATMDEAVGMLSDARLLRSRSSQLWQTLVRTSLTWRQGLVLGVSLLAPVIIAVLVAHVAGASILDSLSQPLLVLTEAAILLGSAMRWARGKMRTASEVLDRIDALRGKLTLERDALLGQQGEALARAEREVERLTRELSDKQSDMDRASAEADDMRRQLGELAPVRRMASFLSERASSNDYRKHLGLVALIRRDLEDLSRLLAMQDEAQEDTGLPAIDRIVLYIDDLDRCPPPRVVELLQAVHLLLAFPLFVVVVAVDARWIARALEESYPALLDAAPRCQGDRATSHDYLEKIFQIPFWIRPLTPAAGAAMIAGLLDRDHAQPIDPREREVMLALSSVAGRSPRALKRFVNVYRLLEAGLSCEERRAFAPGARGRGQYRATLLALAIQIGYPRIADALFDAVMTGPAARHAKAHEDDGNTPARAAWLTALCKRLGKAAPGPAAEQDWTDLARVVSAFCSAHPVTRSELRACIPRVARYSFRHVSC